MLTSPFDLHTFTQPSKWLKFLEHTYKETYPHFHVVQGIMEPHWMEIAAAGLSESASLKEWVSVRSAIFFRNRVTGPKSLTSSNSLTSPNSITGPGLSTGGEDVFLREKMGRRKIRGVKTFLPQHFEKSKFHFS